MKGFSCESVVIRYDFFRRSLWAAFHLLGCDCKTFDLLRSCPDVLSTQEGGGSQRGSAERSSAVILKL